MVWRKRNKKKEIKTKDDFYKAVLGEVRFAWDRQEIKEELTAHLEDLQIELLEEGVEEKESEQRALARMGDAYEIGKALNKAHHFWLGCLWMVTKVCMILALGLGLLLAGTQVSELIGYGNVESQEVEGLIAQGAKYTVQNINRTIEMEHCTITFKKLIRSNTDDDYGCLTYSLKENLIGGEARSGKRVRITTDRDRKNNDMHHMVDGEATLAHDAYENVIWRYHGGAISFRSFPKDATVMYLNYQVFGDDWSLKIPLEEVKWI